MTTDTERRQNPGMVTATRDMGIRKGGGMNTARTVIDYQELREIQASGKGHGLVRFAVVMRMPDEQGEPGAGSEVAMPAEKAQKWYGQGYRFCVGTVTDGGYDTTLVPEDRTEDTPMWLPSTVEDARFKGLPIPEEMAPPGYAGPTFSLKAQREAAQSTELYPREEPTAADFDAAINRTLAETVTVVDPRPPNLKHLNAAGLRAVAEAEGIELRDGRNIAKMKEDIGQHFGLADQVATEAELPVERELGSVDDDLDQGS